MYNSVRRKINIELETKLWPNKSPEAYQPDKRAHVNNSRFMEKLQ